MADQTCLSPQQETGGFRRDSRGSRAQLYNMTALGEPFLLLTTQSRGDPPPVANWHASSNMVLDSVHSSSIQRRPVPSQIAGMGYGVFRPKEYEPQIGLAPDAYHHYSNPSKDAAWKNHTHDTLKHVRSVMRSGYGDSTSSAATFLNPHDHPVHQRCPVVHSTIASHIANSCVCAEKTNIDCSCVPKGTEPAPFEQRRASGLGLNVDARTEIDFHQCSAGQQITTWNTQLFNYAQSGPQSDDLQIQGNILNHTNASPWSNFNRQEAVDEFPRDPHMDHATPLDEKSAIGHSVLVDGSNFSSIEYDSITPASYVSRGTNQAIRSNYSGGSALPIRTKYAAQSRPSVDCLTSRHDSEYGGQQPPGCIPIFVYESTPLPDEQSCHNESDLEGQSSYVIVASVVANSH